jgi:N6-L-threonylcarbamoyladenine synthase
VRVAVKNLAQPNDQDVADICASFEAAIAETLRDRLTRAFSAFAAHHPDVRDRLLIVAGGVAANATLKAVFAEVAAAHHFQLVVPPPRLCTDNGAMIAWAGAERLALGLTDDLAVAARARWPLDQAQAPLVGSGKLGAKV